MNERIREIARQCKITVDMHPGGFPNEQALVVQDFAEAIIRVCADKVAGMVMRDKFDTVPQDPHSQGWNEAVAYASEELKKYFGVKS